MRIAIPVFQRRVSPVFDWSTCLLIVATGETGTMHREEIVIADQSPLARSACLNERQVEVLLCGGISAPLLAQVEAQNIRVYPWVAGDADKVLQAFLEGRISESQYAMPGYCKRQNRQRMKGQGRVGRCGNRNSRPRGHQGKRKEK